MSVVPLMFRDWWDDWETHMPMRSSRLMDQQFGTGLRRDDLLSSFWKPSPSLLRSGYIRPWGNQNLQRQDSGSTLNLDKDKFQVGELYIDCSFYYICEQFAIHYVSLIMLIFEFTQSRYNTYIIYKVGIIHT